MLFQKITINHTKPVQSHNLNEELMWFASSLGLFSSRDKDKSCYRIFIEIIKSTKQHKGLSSDELASRLGLTRGTVVHHLKKLLETGIIVSERNKYMLRMDSLSDVIDELEKDAKRIFSDIRQEAEKLDIRLGLKGGYRYN
jgi:DNA-binding transcriptional ArsR family regulator